MTVSGPNRVRSKERRSCVILALVATTFAPPTTLAQPVDLPIAPATTTNYPPGVAVAKTPTGPVYVDAKDRTLYGLDLRTLVRWGADPAFYCKERCADWQPLLAQAGTAINIAFPQGFGERLPTAC